MPFFAVEFLYMLDEHATKQTQTVFPPTEREPRHAAAMDCSSTMGFISHDYMYSYRGGTKLEERRRANRTSNKHDA